MFTLKNMKINYNSQENYRARNLGSSIKVTHGNVTLRTKKCPTLWIFVFWRARKFAGKFMLKPFKTNFT
jgi:hypothetical protein